MSVTITIAGEANRLYSERCPVCEHGLPSPNCDLCAGSGVAEFEPGWELSIPNAAFSLLWKYLGLDPGPENLGEMDGRTLSVALWRLEVQMTQPAYAGGFDQEAYTDKPIRKKKLRRYLSRLEEIAEEAESREDPVIWA